MSSYSKKCTKKVLICLKNSHIEKPPIAKLCYFLTLL